MEAVAPRCECSECYLKIGVIQSEQLQGVEVLPVIKEIPCQFDQDGVSSAKMHILKHRFDVDAIAANVAAYALPC